jgi:hypothetical protein
MVYLLMGDTANANKCIIQAALTGIALPAGGLAIGSLCNISGTARIITALTLVGAGMYTVGTSFVDFCSYFEKLSKLILSKVDESGKVTLYELDTTGKILGEWP